MSSDSDPSLLYIRGDREFLLAPIIPSARQVSWSSKESSGAASSGTFRPIPQRIPPSHSIPRKPFVRSAMAGSAPPEATNRVTFDLIDAPPGTGVRMSYLDYMDPQDETRKFMVNAEEPIDCFTRDDGSKCSSVHFRIKWPGYSHVTRSQTRAIRVFNPGPVVNPFITRIELAIAIVGHFKTWAEHAQTMGIGPTFQEWAVAPEALYLDNLWLVSFYQMPDRICYAEINTYFK